MDGPTDERILGEINNTYNEVYEFKTTWWIFWPNYQFVNVIETIQFTYNSAKEKKYILIEMVWKRTNHSKFIMLQLWIKIWSEGRISSFYYYLT
ncbi:MAG: hypothetical protein ACFFCV_21955 [Promethearchaeota archaeon]